MRWKPSRKLIILVATGVALIAAYTLYGFFGVPRLVRAQLTDFAQRSYQRALTLGAVRFNPFTLTLEIDDLAFPDADRAPMLGFERLTLNFGIASLWRLGASFQSIDLDQPFCRAVIRPGGALNLADLARALPASAPAEKPARFFVDRLQVSRGAFDFEDRARATPFHAKLTPLSFTLREFSTIGESGNAYSLRAASADGGSVSWNGTFALAPFSSRGSFELAEVSAEKIWSYLRDTLAFRVGGGALTVKGGYEFGTTAQGSALRIDLAEVNVADLTVGPRAGTENYLKLTRLGIGPTRLDMRHARADIGKVRFEGGAVILRREADGRINLLELMNTPVAQESSVAPQPAATPADSSARNWVINAPDLAIEALTVSLEDRFVSPAASFALDPITVTVRGYSNHGAQPVEIETHIGIGKNGRVSARGTASPATKAFRASIELDDLDLAALQPYIGTYTQMTVLTGLLDSKLDVERPASGALRIAGRTVVTDLRTVDDALKQDFIQWERLELSGIEYRSGPEDLRIASIAARSPYLRLIISPDQTTNIGRILTVPAAAPGAVQTVRTGATQTSAPSKPLRVRIDKVTVAKGSANFADFWIQPNFAVSIQDLGGSIGGLSSDPRSRARLSLIGKLDRYAPVMIEGEVNLLSASLFTDLKVNFKGVELTSVTPYSGRFAGYRIERGKLSVDLVYHVENRKLDAEQRFVIDRLQLGEAVDSPDAVRLPLKLAVALLEDRNGVIDLGLPVTGSLDDPQFRIGPLIWKAFVNLLGDIARSPFTLLGTLFGGGPELNLIDFEAGSATLTEAAAGKMTALRKAMTERPQLALDVPAISAAEIDAPALARLALGDKLPGAGEPAPRFDALLALHRAELGNVPLPAAAQVVAAQRARDRTPVDLEMANIALADAVLAGHAPSEAALEELARARGRAIQEALLGSGEIEATRVFMLAAQSRPAVDGKVRLELSPR